jgi:flagellar motility protein MotE (MotC chaperone)
MSTMLKEVYDALKEAGASEEKASAAAIAVSVYQLDRERLATKDDIAALKENIAALDKRLAVVETGLNRVERLLWAAVIGVIVTAIRVWFPIP